MDTIYKITIKKLNKKLQKQNNHIEKLIAKNKTSVNAIG